jgi:hypothetical protein
VSGTDRLRDELLAGQRCAGDREVGLVPAVGAFGRDDAGLGDDLAPRSKGIPDAAGETHDQDVRSRRHREDLAVEQLVARVRAVIERQELLEGPKPPGWLSHLPFSRPLQSRRPSYAARLTAAKARAR